MPGPGRLVRDARPVEPALWSPACGARPEGPGARRSARDSWPGSPGLGGTARSARSGRPCSARPGTARHGTARHGRPGPARPGSAGSVCPAWARLGEARSGQGRQRGVGVWHRMAEARWAWREVPGGVIWNERPDRVRGLLVEGPASLRAESEGPVSGIWLPIRFGEGGRSFEGPRSPVRSVEHHPSTGSVESGVPWRQRGSEGWGARTGRAGVQVPESGEDLRRGGGGGGTTLPATRSASATATTESSRRRTFSTPSAHACRFPTTSLYPPLGSRRRSDTRRPTSEGDTETMYRAEKCGPM